MGSERETDKAKRAILGLCDYEMDNGVLTKINAGRNGEIIIPEGCVEIQRRAILIDEGVRKVRFCDSIERCSSQIFNFKNFDYFSYPPLMVDFGETSFNVAVCFAYNLYGSLLYTAIRIRYVFGENNFVEQAVGIMTILLDTLNIGLRVTDRATLGLTDVSDKMFDPVILKQMRDYIKDNNVRIDDNTRVYLECAEKRAGITVGK
jgi:hypothetical protein